MASIDPSLIARVKALLLSPKTEWPVIAAEPTDIGTVYRNYLVWLAAIPAIAAFIGFSLIGIGGFGVTFRVPFFSGLVNAVVGLVLTLAMCYVLALIVNALAPTFKGEKNLVNAFKLVAYGSTASMVAGIAYLMPALSIIALVGALYTIYLIYVGLPVLMKCPQDKAMPYTVVLILCGIVAGIVLGVVSALITPSPAKMAGGDVKITTPQGEVSINTGKLDEFAKKMEEAGKKMEQASKSGDPAAMGKAATEALASAAGAVGGKTDRTPIASQDLKALLPEKVQGLARGNWEARSGTAMGVAGSSARAEYGEGDKRVSLEISDIGGLSGLMSIAGWMGVTGERETATKLEKTYKQGKRMVHERMDKSSKQSEYKVVLENGVVVEAEGEGVDVAGLKSIVDALDLKRLEGAN